MKTHSDLEVATQLEQLWHTIERGITTANEAVVKAKDIQLIILEDTKRCEQIQSEFVQNHRVIQNNAREVEIQQVQLVENIKIATQIRDELALQVTQLSDYQATFEQFKQDLEAINHSINAAQNQARLIEAILPESTKELPQQLEEFKQLALQLAIDKKEAAHFLEQTQDKAKLVVDTYSGLQQLKSQVESIINDFGGKQKLDTISNSFKAAQTEIEYLHKKLETQTKQQSLLRNWLIAVSIGTAIALIFAIVR